MAVSRLLPAGGANDFNVNVGGAYTSVTFTKEYSSGSYSMVSGDNDSTYDVYIYNASGANVGYTKSGSLTASAGFNKMVILGGTTGDVLSFSYKTTFVSVDDSDEVTAGPVVVSVSPSAVPSIDDTFTVTGRNFASDCTVTFTGTGYSATAAKNIVRSSATSLIVTRPDNMPPEAAPYTITVENPGVTNPTGANSHILTNSITSGTNPAWSTPSVLQTFSKGIAFSQTFLATDTEALDIDYSLVTGSFPTGLTLNEESGVLNGTPTSTSNVSFTIRATDTGGNFLDRAFTSAHAIPAWGSNAALSFTQGVAFSRQLVATHSTTGATLSYSIATGTLPTGVTMTSGGLISGTPSANTATATITFRATDNGANTADLAIATSYLLYTGFVSPTTFTNSVGTRFGPTITQVRTQLGNPAWANTYLTQPSHQGYNLWTVPEGGTYQITVAGAAGRGASYNNAGGGNIIRANMTLVAGAQYYITTGACPTGGQVASNGGSGGMSAFAMSDGATALLVGGGGSGSSSNTSSYRNGQYSTDGTGTYVSGTDGGGGSYSSYVSGGGGWNTDGGTWSSGGTGKGWTLGGVGGDGGAFDGGFGGGTGGSQADWPGGAGGGGYRGGNGTSHGSNGGGTSYANLTYWGQAHNMSNVTNVGTNGGSGTNSQGYVTITKL